MNGKRAKHLRSNAKVLAFGMPEVNYRRGPGVGKLIKDQFTGEIIGRNPDQTEVDPQSVRGVYLELKRRAA